MTKKEFLDVLNKHDWYYMMSDSMKVYSKGEEEFKQIQKIILLYPNLINLYNKEHKKRFKK